MECLKPRVSQWATLVLALGGGFSGALYAAKPLPLQHLSFSALQKKLAIPLIGSQGLAASTADLSVVEKHSDALHRVHTRMQQHYEGIPVLGGYAIFHQSIPGAVPDSIRMNGTLYQQLFLDLGHRPAWLRSKAQTVLAQYGRQFLAAQITQQQVTPVIYIDETHQAVWAYQVRVSLQPENNIPSRPSAIIDARQGQILLEWNDLPSLRHIVHGLGFGGNKKIGKYQFGKNMPLLTLIRDDDSGQCFLENQSIRVVDMQHHGQKSSTPMHFECETALQDDQYWTGYEGDGYDKINGGYSVANDAMYVSSLVQEMYRKKYGQEVLSNGQHPMQLIVRIHYSTHFANAFWDGQQITFGDGDQTVYPLVSLGIAAHEISHGFTQQHAGLVYYGQAGAINESFSDMAAQAAENYAQGQASWLIGADIIKGVGALRFFKKPSRDGLSIDRADQYQVGMDVHHSSGVYNQLFYLLAHSPNWDIDKAFTVMLKANTDYWTPTASFKEAACGVLSASQDLGFNTDPVMDALDEVMIDYSDC